MRMRIIIAIGLSLLFLFGIGVAQTDWERSPNNSVLVAGPEGGWDEVGVSHPSVLFDGDRYHLWYAGENGSLRSIGYARSDDGIAWEEYPANPVLEDGSGPAWDGKMVSQPAVIFAEGIYHLWYAGSDGGEARIGYATSDDGVEWGRVFRDPVLDVGAAGSWDGKGVSRPSVVYVEGRYHMWYTGYDGDQLRIGYATSGDGVTWARNSSDPALDVGAVGSWDSKGVSSPSVVYAGGIYHMWYTGYDGELLRIGYATSGDGVTWARNSSDPVLDVGAAGSWDSKGVSSPSVVSEEDIFRMWYTGSGGRRVGIGYASSYARASAIVGSPIGMDFDPREGDQGKSTAGGAVPGKIYSLEMHIANGPEISGWRAVVEYDTDRLLYQKGSFEAGDFLSELLTLEDVGEGRVEVGGAVLELALQNSGDGFLGRLSFQVRDDFFGSTELVITRVGFLHADGTEENLQVRGSATITAEPDSRLVGDFDGSGAVDFSDFFLFVEAFGGEDPAFDLDASGAVDFEDFFLFAESFNRDARGKLMALAEVRLGLPSGARLEPNYPNPFNGETVISFELPTSADVDLAVFDLAGQEVVELVNGFCRAGRHAIRWNSRDTAGRELASGVYLYVLRVGQQEERRKMVLVR